MSSQTSDQTHEFRDLLEDFIRGVLPRNQPEQMDALRKDLPHSIVLRERGEGAPYTCYMYALGLHECPEVLAEVAKMNQGKWITANVIAAWIEGGLLEEVAEDNLASAAIVIYFHEGRPVHAGAWRQGRVISKWGSGHLWEHALWELPLGYGEIARFFRVVGKEELLGAFRRLQPSGS